MIFWWSSFISMIYVKCPLSRFQREVLIRIIHVNPIEFQIAMLIHQVKNLSI
jgi:hypothetical protein